MMFLTPFSLPPSSLMGDDPESQAGVVKITSPTIYNMSWHIIITLATLSMVAFAFVTPLSNLLPDRDHLYRVSCFAC